MSQPKLISIGGKRGAGKGEIASHLVKAHGYTVHKLASPLKDMLRAFLREAAGYNAALIERCIEGDLKEVPIPEIGGASPRELMQTLGTEWAQSIYPGMWIDMMVSRVSATIADGGKVVVDDMRFPHEADVLSRLGAQLWLVETDHDWRAEAEAKNKKQLNGRPVEEAMSDIAERMVATLMSNIPGHAWTSGHERWFQRVPAFGYKTPQFMLDNLLSQWIPTAFAGASGLDKKVSAHKSEVPLPAELFSVRIENNGTIAELQRAVDCSLDQKRDMRAEREEAPAADFCP